VSIAAVALVWTCIVIASMVVVAYLATRWGRDPFGWALLAAVMGPIAVIGLVGTRQSDIERPAPFEAVPDGPPAPGPCVVAACDGSSAGARIARYIADLHREGIDVIVLTVLPREARPGEAWAGAPGEHERRVTAATAEPLRILRAAGMTAHAIVGYGSPSEEILRCAEQEHAEVIIVGRRGAGLTKALLGSVSDHVVREAKQPVVVVE